MSLTPAQREVRRLGGQARARQFTPEYQRWARSHQPYEITVRAARAGARAVIARYGLSLLAERQRRRPSSCERAVHRLLEDELGERSYQTQVEVRDAHGPMLLDIAWPELRLAIEVYGPVHERLRSADEQRREAARLERLDRLGWHVVVLTDADLRDTARVRRAITGALDEARCRAGSHPESQLEGHRQ